MGNPNQQLRSQGPLGHGAAGERSADSRNQERQMARDAAKAAVEDIMRLWVASTSNARLIAEAKDKSDQIFSGDTAGPRHHNAIVKTLFEMLHTLEGRIQQAPRDKQTLLPKLDGVKFSPNDPIAPLVEAIHPFGMSNFWTMQTVPGFPTPKRRRLRARKPGTPPKHTDKPKTDASGMKLPEPNAPPGLGKGLETNKGDEHKKGLGDLVKGKPQDILEGIISDMIPAFELWLLGKTAYDYLTKWIYARAEGLKIAECRVALRVLPHAIASMALKIGPPNTTRRRPSVSSPSMHIGGTIVPWDYVSIPEPDASGAKEALQMIANSALYNKRSDVRGAVAAGRANGLRYAKQYIENLNGKKSGSGHKYLWSLKYKVKKYDNIVQRVTADLRKQICGQQGLSPTQLNECRTELNF